jgi:hypothetical protein
LATLGEIWSQIDIFWLVSKTVSGERCRTMPGSHYRRSSQSRFELLVTHVCLSNYMQYLPGKNKAASRHTYKEATRKMKNPRQRIQETNSKQHKMDLCKAGPPSMTPSSLRNTPLQPQRRILQHRPHKRINTKTERESHDNDYSLVSNYFSRSAQKQKLTQWICLYRQ